MTTILPEFITGSNKTILLLEMNFKLPCLSLCPAKTQAALSHRNREREGQRRRERGEETALPAYRKR